jgi:hypothetical protein
MPYAPSGSKRKERERKGEHQQVLAVIPPDNGLKPIKKQESYRAYLAI